MKRKVRLAVGGGLVLLIFCGFIFSVVNQGVGAFQYYHELGEFNTALKAGKAGPDQGLRLNGKVLPGSIRKDLDKMQIEFKLTDGTTALPVVLTRVDVSDLFKDDANVVIEGRLRTDGIFQAEQLMTKCPTKYEAADSGQSVADKK